MIGKVRWSSTLVAFIFPSLNTWRDPRGTGVRSCPGGLSSEQECFLWDLRSLHRAGPLWLSAMFIEHMEEGMRLGFIPPKNGRSGLLVSTPAAFVFAQTKA